MRKHVTRTAAIGLAALLGFGLPSAQAADLPQPYNDTKSAAVWAGVGLKDDVIAGYAGGVFALNGDLGSTGILLRASGLYVDYDFNTALSPNGRANGDLYRVNGSLGYQIVGEAITWALFAGVDYQDRDINPGVANDGRLNDEAGFIVNARIATNGGSMFPLTLEGHYSTANNDFWARAQTGFDLASFTVGPEASILGNDAYTEARFGGYASWHISSDFDLQFRAGYAEQLSGAGGSNSGGDGAYGGASMVFTF